MVKKVMGIDVNKLPEFSSCEIDSMIREIKKGRVELREEFLLANVRLVLLAIKKFKTVKESPDDLFQVGMLGLIKATDNFILGEFKYSNNLKHEREVILDGEVVKIKDRIENGVSRLIVPIEKDKILRINDNEIVFSINKVKAKITSSNKIQLKDAFISLYKNERSLS